MVSMKRQLLNTTGSGVHEDAKRRRTSPGAEDRQPTLTPSGSARSNSQPAESLGRPAESLGQPGSLQQATTSAAAPDGSTCSKSAKKPKREVHWDDDVIIIESGSESESGTIQISDGDFHSLEGLSSPSHDDEFLSLEAEVAGAEAELLPCRTAPPKSDATAATATSPDPAVATQAAKTGAANLATGGHSLPSLEAAPGELAGWAAAGSMQLLKTQARLTGSASSPPKIASVRAEEDAHPAPSTHPATELKHPAGPANGSPPPQPPTIPQQRRPFFTLSLSSCSDSDLKSDSLLASAPPESPEEQEATSPAPPDLLLPADPPAHASCSAAAAAAVGEQAGVHKGSGLTGAASPSGRVSARDILASRPKSKPRPKSSLPGGKPKASKAKAARPLQPLQPLQQQQQQLLSQRSGGTTLTAGPNQAPGQPPVESGLEEGECVPPAGPAGEEAGPSGVAAAGPSGVAAAAPSAPVELEVGPASVPGDAAWVAPYVPDPEARQRFMQTLETFRQHMRHLETTGRKSNGDPILKKHDMVAASELKHLKPQPHFGHTPGIELGQKFEGRGDLDILGIHMNYTAGIFWMGKDKPAMAICMAGGYMCNNDEGTKFIYSGMGGRDNSSGQHVKDQQWTKGNEALRMNVRHRMPVRVIRGGKTEGKIEYTYDGLYYVTRCYQEATEESNGYLVCKFELEAIPGHSGASRRVTFKCMNRNQTRYTNVKLAGRTQVPRRRAQQADDSAAASLTPAQLAAAEKQRLKDLKRRTQAGQRMIDPDLTNGLERVRIPVFNDIDDTKIPSSFKYVRECYVDTEAAAQLSQHAGHLMAAWRPSRCGLACMRRKEPIYNPGHLLQEKTSLGIYECAPNCIGKKCRHNRVFTEHGLSLPLEVFYTGPDRGFGVRCSQEIQIGQMVAEYAGRIITSDEADHCKNDSYLLNLDHFTLLRRQTTPDDPEYPHCLQPPLVPPPPPATAAAPGAAGKQPMEPPPATAAGADAAFGEASAAGSAAAAGEESQQIGAAASDGAAGGEAAPGPSGLGRTAGDAGPSAAAVVDGEAGEEGYVDEGPDFPHLTIDACYRGNISRFFNHSCDSNLLLQPLLTPTCNALHYKMVLFAQQVIPPGTELTWDYGYKVLNDPAKALYCKCRSDKCRGRIL